MRANLICSSRREENRSPGKDGHGWGLTECWSVGVLGFHFSNTPSLHLPVYGQALLHWLPLVILPALVFGLRARLPAWGFMWLMAVAILFGCKWLTWRKCEIKPGEPWKNGAYFFLWPGLDAAAFLGNVRPPGSANTRPWFAAAGKTLFGGVLLWGIVREVPASLPLLSGWCGLLGLIFLLHFGAFHLLSLAWRSVGVNAQSLMRAPIRATSLGDFWGRRWNVAFSQVAHDVVFRPVLRQMGAKWATVAVFLVSGLVHELVISVPARGGYGLPTLYFLVQAAGTTIERSMFGRNLRLRHGFAGWVFTALFTGGPVFWLFHPPFVQRVVLPFLRAIGAL